MPPRCRRCHRILRTPEDIDAQEQKKTAAPAVQSKATV